MEFTSPDLLSWLKAAADDAVDALPFGVIGMDGNGLACLYSDYESQQARLPREQVLAQNFFEQVAPCMNNLMVAGRFADARRSSAPLDANIDYVLAFRSHITPVRLRLLYSPDMPLHYLLVQRPAESDA